MKIMTAFAAGLFAGLLLGRHQPACELSFDIDDLMSSHVFDRRIRLRCQPARPVSKGVSQTPR